MPLFEILFSATTLVLLFLTCFYENAKFKKLVLVVAASCLLLHLVVETPRWQMSFTYLIFLITILMLMKGSRWHLVLRSLGMITGILLLFISVFYSYYMPVINLPAPSGIYPVGTANYTLTDPVRIEQHVHNRSHPRKVFIKAWYPGKSVPPGTPEPESLWLELHPRRGGPG